MITGTIWRCACGRHHKRPVVSVAIVNEHIRERDAMSELIRQVSDEVVLLPVATLNAIAERAENAERRLRALGEEVMP